MLDLFAPQGPEVLVLAAFRVAGLLMIAPVFAARNIPLRLRAALTVLLAVLMFPAAHTNALGGVTISPAAALAETLIGMAVGLGAALLIGAAEVMGDLLSVQTGLAGAASLDPITFMRTAATGQFAGIFATTLLFSLDAHTIMLRALADTYRVLPIGGLVDFQAGTLEMIRAYAVLFTLGMQFAGPVIAAVALSNIALGVLSRAAPQMQILAIAFPLQIGLGLFAFAASIPLIGSILIRWGADYTRVLDGILAAFRGGPLP